VEVVRPASAVELLDRAGEFLAAREAEHNLLLGLASRLRNDARIYGEEPYFAVVEAGGRVVAVALRTPPHNLVLSEMDDAGAIDPLVEDVRSVFGSLTGAIGPADRVPRFAEAWEAATGQRGTRAIAERIFRADRIDPPEGVPGRMRDYEAGDRDVAVLWAGAFEEEAMPHASPDSKETFVDGTVADPDGGLVFWEDGGDTVAMAGFRGPTPNGIRIGPVYTPPERRRRGYGSALTAALSLRLLETRRFCFLFTDLANPTSNSIYRRMGYEPVTDVDLWVFA
jgi:predicted GNAT family acetyltransferase